MKDHKDRQGNSASNKPKKRKLFLGCLLTVFVLIALVIIGREGFIRYNIAYAKENPTFIPSSFAGSVQRHDYRMVKALTSPNLWPEIEDWMSKHEQVKCPLLPRFTLGDEGQGGGSVIIREEQNIYIGHQYVSIVCPDPKHYYCLEVTDIIVKQEEDQWMVTEIGSIEEYWSEYNCNFR